MKEIYVNIELHPNIYIRKIEADAIFIESRIKKIWVWKDRSRNIADDKEVREMQLILHDMIKRKYPELLL